ncbi:MAG: NapC/NirT family cytochrome c [Planctomycetes bacterium]|nr:NapC/NirT family cytochrome c [Planctomycetota bacterium]MBI3845515.1 NapC/NirT family cytochrome c [Planctomycetota bacterium]
MRRFLPRSFFNVITLVGACLSLLSLTLILFLTALEAFSGHSKPYIGVVTFVILPVLFLMGAGLILGGAYRAHRRQLKGKPFALNVDLSTPRHRATAGVLGVGGGLFLTVSIFLSFQAYEYTDSPSFCGGTCHPVMEPEETAYQFSPHARVACAQCHIGPGAAWFVRSKLSGTYQVYATLFDKFPRPIPTPIENLRPAQETCEQCHWPKHFLSEKLQVHDYFLGNEANTRWSLHLLLKTGGGNIEVGPTSGIHWHMNIGHKVEYVPIDRQRLVIPWVSSTNPEGQTVVYRTTDASITDEQIAAAPKRRMDCIDCHNRPAHIYRPPSLSVNVSMAVGWIDPQLPFVKSVSVRALRDNYTSKQEAQDGIRSTVEDFYRSYYPALATERASQIERTVKEVQRIYSRNFFPEMKVNWKTFPNHIGHLYSPGCFRCHDGKHQTAEGKVLSKDCNVCHTILAQEITGSPQRLALEGIEYRHPVDIGNAWKEMNCFDCHGKQ